MIVPSPKKFLRGVDKTYPNTYHEIIQEDEIKSSEKDFIQREYCELSVNRRLLNHCLIGFETGYLDKESQHQGLVLLHTSENDLLYTACLSGAAKLTRRQSGEKKYCPRERGRKLEHRVARFQRCASAGVVYAHFFFLIQYLRLLSAVLARWKI